MSQTVSQSEPSQIPTADELGFDPGALREQYAADFGFRHTAFCAVAREESHPARPADYQPLDAFWRARDYFPQNQLVAHFDWTDVGDNAPSRKAMQFWLHSL